MRPRLEGVPQRYHEDHITARGVNSESLQSCAQNSFRCLKHSKYPMQRRQWRKNGKLGEDTGMVDAKVRNKKEVIDEARTKGRKVHFASLMDLCHLKNSELEPVFQKKQRSNCTPR